MSHSLNAIIMMKNNIKNVKKKNQNKTRLMLSMQHLPRNFKTTTVSWGLPINYINSSIC